MADDRLPLEAFVESVAGQFLTAAERVEARHPGWQIGAVTLTARVALKPVREGDATVIYVDVDEPERLMSDLPIPLARRPGT